MPREGKGALVRIPHGLRYLRSEAVGTFTESAGPSTFEIEFGRCPQPEVRLE
jgi:hypothetical protein